MFNLERGPRYWLCSEPTDMRKSFHTLSGLVRNKIGGDPMNGDVSIYMNKRRNRIKLLLLGSIRRESFGASRHLYQRP